MKVYLAHNYRALNWLNQNVIPRLKELEIEVTSRWLLGKHEGGNNDQYAREDIEDVKRADLLIYFAHQFEGSPGCGKHIELGFALGNNQQVVIIGQTEELNSVFHFLSFGNIRRYESFEEFLSVLKTASLFKRL